MIVIRSPISTTFSSTSASHYLGYQSITSSRSSTPTQLSLRSPIFLSNTPRKRHLSSTIDVTSPEDQLNHCQRPLKRVCNSLDFIPNSTIKLKPETSENNGTESVTKGVNNNREKGVSNPFNIPTLSLSITKMDVEMESDMGMGMGSDMDMEGVILQSKSQVLQDTPSFLSSTSSTRPKLGRLDTTSSLDFEPGLTIKQYPSSSSINDMSTSPTKSSSLPPVMHLKRNPKKLSLSLPALASSSSSYLTSTSDPSPSCSTPSTICPTPTYSHAESDSKFGTPYTPGPPKTPALAMSLGRSTMKGNRRPSLLSLITNPPGNDDLPPPTPGMSGSGAHPYATMRLKNKGRARSHTAAEVLNIPDQHNKSAFGNASFPPIDEIDPSTQSTGLSALGYALPTTSSPQSQGRSYHSSSSPTTSASSNLSDDAASTSSTPSTSPPLPTAFTFSLPLNDYYNQQNPKRQMEPYEDGPIEILPGIYLGAEESVFQFDSYASSSSSSSKVRIINVAQEIDNPFESNGYTRGWSNPNASGSNSSKGKEKMKLSTYPRNENRPEIEYCHIRWSHGELGLADLPSSVNLLDIISPPPKQTITIPEEGEVWGFWETIKWMEDGRKNGIPILIHCQCGVSRSATLAIAYTMALAAIGAMPDMLGGIKSMQDAYDFVKSKSSWIGPNHSLVFQLVDFARHLTQLLSAHLSSSSSKLYPIQTSFPSSKNAELTEAEWARRRREFEETENGGLSSTSSTSSSSDSPLPSEGSESDRQRMKENEFCISPEEADEEARRLDEEMLLRKARR